jgi:dTMP kinase
MTNQLFLTFEGGDGAGKTTLIQTLHNKLSSLGHEVLVTREPGGTPLGDEIRSLLLSKKTPITSKAELALFLASRAQHVEEVILPALSKGKIVLCDRFSDSTIAYQGAARHLGIEKTDLVCQFFSDDLKPDLTFYLDISPTEAQKRVKRAFDRIESEDISFHETIREAFLQIAKKEPDRFKPIDATKSPEEVAKQAIKLLMPIMQEKGFAGKL